MALQKMPVGIVLFLIYTGISLAGMVFSLNFPVFQFGPVIYQGITASFILIFYIIILGLVFYGTIKRKKWARVLGIIFYSVLILLSIANLVFFMVNDELREMIFSKGELPQELMPLVENLSIAISIAVEALMILIVIYLARKREYFIAQD